MAALQGLQNDLFGGIDEATTQAAAPPMMTAQGWQMPESHAFAAALKRGGLVEALGVINRLNVETAGKVLVETGFEIGGTGSRAEMMAPVQRAIVEAVRERMTGHELRAAGATKAAAQEETKSDPEVALRALWDEQGVSKERQAELIAQIASKAAPGAKVGPFVVGEQSQVAPQPNVFANKAVTVPAPGRDRAASKESEKNGLLAETANTEDAGAELTYNRRNRLMRGLRWEDVANKNDALRIKEVVKSKVYIKPDYQALIDGGMPAIAAHLVKQVYDAIAVSPQVGRRTVTDEDMQRYIGAVNRVMGGVHAWASNSTAVGEWAKKQANVAGAMVGRPVSVLDMVDAKDLLEAVYPDGWKNNKVDLHLLGGNKLLGALQPGYDEARRALKDIEKGWPGKREAWQQQGYKIVTTAEVASVRPTGRDGRFYVSVMNGSAGIFDNEAQAQEAFAKLEPVLLLNKSGRIVGQFASVDAATVGAREATKRDGGSATISEKGLSVESAERVGVVRRLEGENVSSDRLQAEFGFRGVNFGNWMKGSTPAKVAERQLHLNHAYDAFHDLADILGVPPKAMSLDGMLGLAIGAQGGGKNLAHFVPGVNEINLTRTAGAGALAHEWAHAVDHYFGTLGGLERNAIPYLTENIDRKRHEVQVVNGRSVVVELPFNETLRPEIVERIKAVVDTMTRRMETIEEAQASEVAALKRTEKNVVGWLAAIRREFETGGRFKDDGIEAKRAAGLQAFDKLADRVRAGDYGDGYVAIGQSTTVMPVVSEIRDAYKAAFGRVIAIDPLKGLQSNLRSLRYSQERAAAGEARELRRVSSDYQKASNAADKDKSKPYWGTRIEMFARAFDAYVVDTLEGQAAKNSYLAGIEAVPPAGEERKAINQAIGALVGEFKSKETERGVALFSFAGEKAAGVDRFALATAKERLAAGESAEAVRLATGWMKGVDEKWRFEISDADAKLKRPYPEKGQRWGDIWKARIANRQTNTLGEMLDHPALFAAYPSLADMPVSTQKGSGASYSVQSRQIDIGEDVQMHKVCSMLLHEIQHGIQTIEGFATGGNARSAAVAPSLYSDDVKQADETVKQAALSSKGRLGELARQYWRDGLRGKEMFEYQQLLQTLPEYVDLQEARSRYQQTGTPSDVYRKLAGEVEARNVQLRQRYTETERRERSPESTQDVALRDVVVTFNGRVMANAPLPEVAWRVPAGVPVVNNPHSVESLTAAIDAAFPETPGFARLLAGTGRFEMIEEKDVAEDLAAAQFSRSADGEVFEGKEVPRTPMDNGMVTIEVDGVLRPAQNSAGKPIHWSEEGTRNFWRAFAGSKAIDGEGRPIVGYHGTSVRTLRDGKTVMGDIESFDRMFTTNFRQPSIDTVGSWFSSNPGDDGALMYAGGGRAEGSVIYPAFLAIENPHETTFHLMLRRARLLANGKDDGRMIGEAEVNAYRKWLKDIGKDGIKIVHDERAENGSTEFKNQTAWIALEPTQIKSAIGNRGDFDIDNADIRYSKDGRILGYVIDGKTRLVVDNIDRLENDVRGLLLHEVGVHALRLGRKEPAFQAILDEFEGMREAGNPAVLAAYARVPKSTAAHLIAEEALGYLVEDHPELPLVAKVKAWFKEKVCALVDAVPGGDRVPLASWAKALTPEDMVYMAASATRGAVGGVERDRESVGRAAGKGGRG